MKNSNDQLQYFMYKLSIDNQDNQYSNESVNVSFMTYQAISEISSVLKISKADVVAKALETLKREFQSNFGFDLNNSKTNRKLNKDLSYYLKKWHKGKSSIYYYIVLAFLINAGSARSADKDAIKKTFCMLLKKDGEINDNVTKTEKKFEDNFRILCSVTSSGYGKLFNYENGIVKIVDKYVDEVYEIFQIEMLQWL